MKKRGGCFLWLFIAVFVLLLPSSAYARKTEVKTAKIRVMSTHLRKYVKSRTYAREIRKQQWIFTRKILAENMAKSKAAALQAKETAALQDKEAAVAKVVKAKLRKIVEEKKKNVVSLTLNPSAVSIYNGENVHLTATGTSGSSYNGAVQFISLNSKVASVDNQGNVTARKAGKTVIKASPKNISGKSASCLVTVKKIPEDASVQLPYAEMEIYVGEKVSQEGTISVSDLQNPEVLYSSSDSTIASVSSDGEVTGISEGTVTISAYSGWNPAISGSYTVYVKGIPENAAVQFAYAEREIYIGDKVTQQGVISLLDLQNSDILYSSSDPAVASVSSDGEVSGIAKGTAVITAYSVWNPAITGSYTVNVKEKQTINDTRYIAHRGLSSKAPENTAEAFILAGQNGFWGVETDIRVTKDGKYICLHDADFSRMCGVDRKPEDMTLEEIQRLQVTGGNNIGAYAGKTLRICTLERYLKICKKYHMVPIIELKIACGANLALNGTLLQNLELKDIDETMLDIDRIVSSIMEEDSYVYSAFDADVLEEMHKVRTRKREKNVVLQRLVKKLTEKTIQWCQNYQAEINVKYTNVTFEQIRQIKKAGITLTLWTVDNKTTAEKLIGYGVDHIVTNTITGQ